MEMTIRKAIKSDSKRITEINIKSWQDTYKNIFPIEFLNSLDEMKESTILKTENKINEYLVAEVDNKVVGFIRIGKNKKDYPDNYAEIYSLYVDKEYKSKGIGSSLIDKSFKVLKDNFDYCLVSTLKENQANEFYMKKGANFIKEVDFVLKDKKYVENLYFFDLK